MKDASRQGKTAVVVGTVTNDVRLFDVPKLTVSFFKFDLNFENLIFSYLILKNEGMRSPCNRASSRQNH
jgi:hypothetical protein